jgi:uncharacterized protein (DUF488 family)
VPWSRRPEFAKKALAEVLADAGIGYVHLKALGNPKPGRDAARAGDMDTYRRIFGAQLETEAAQAELRTLADLVREAPSCLMCYEADPARCHRAMVVEALMKRETFEVLHLFPAANVD